MDSYKLLLSPTNQATRILLRNGPDEVLKAMLPPPSQMRHLLAASTLLEGLSMWLGTTLPVALCVDAQEASFCLGLTNEAGVGHQSSYYRLEVTEPEANRRRGIRIPGIGDFRDLRQLRLWCERGGNF